MKRFKSVLLIPPIGLTSAVSPRERAIRKTEKGQGQRTDQMSSRTWSSTHASYAEPHSFDLRGGLTNNEDIRTSHRRLRYPARVARPRDLVPTVTAARRNTRSPCASAPGYSAAQGSLHRPRHVRGSAAAGQSRPGRACATRSRRGPCSGPCGSCAARHDAEKKPKKRRDVRTCRLPLLAPSHAYACPRSSFPCPYSTCAGSGRRSRAGLWGCIRSPLALRRSAVHPLSPVRLQHRRRSVSSRETRYGTDSRTYSRFALRQLQACTSSRRSRPSRSCRLRR